MNVDSFVKFAGKVGTSGEDGTDDDGDDDGEDATEDGKLLGVKVAALSDPEDWGGEEIGLDGWADDVAVLQRSSNSPSRTSSL